MAHHRAWPAGSVPISSSIPTSAYVEHFDPQLAHHRAWLLAVLERLVTHAPQALEEGATLRRLWSEHQQTASAARPQPSQIDPLQSRPQPPGPAAPISDIPAAVALAMPLVKEFEGCRLSAYPDPETGAEPWTIGWGTSTYSDGTPVKGWDTISQELAAGSPVGWSAIGACSGSWCPVAPVQRQPAGRAAVLHLQLRPGLVRRRGFRDAHHPALPWRAGPGARGPDALRQPRRPERGGAAPAAQGRSRPVERRPVPSQ